MGNTDRDILEMLIDRYGVYNVVSHMASICADKAEHISANWQDVGLAKVWQQMEEQLGLVLPALEQLEGA